MAAELSLFEPNVLRGVVEKFNTPESLTMLNRVPKTSWPFPSVTWDILRGSRAIARPNVPNSEAHIVPQLGRSQGSASFIYLREKKVFSPTAIHWIRQPGTLAKANAESIVLREVQDLNVRFDNFAEYCIWQALTGSINFSYPDVVATADYKFAATHKPTITTSWATATPTQIINDVTSWKRLVQRDGRVVANEAYASEETMALIFNSFAANGNAGTNFQAGTLLSDRMKDQYFASGTLPGFLGVNWGVQGAVYDATDAAYTANPTGPGEEQRFLNQDSIVFGNFTDGRPIELMEGPTADDSAPQGFTGKFAKTWKEADPSARQYLLEWHMLPVITRPEQFVYISDVTPA